MGQLNQFQILGIASISFASLALIMSIAGSKNIAFLNMQALNVGMFLLVGGLACMAAACILSSESSEAFGPSVKWYLPLGKYAMPGSNDCAQCVGCRTGRSPNAYAPDMDDSKHHQHHKHHQKHHRKRHN